MTYKIIYKNDKKKIEEITDFSFNRRDQAERYYTRWCNDRDFIFVRIENIRELKGGKK